jgi:hypothetical protein
LDKERSGRKKLIESECKIPIDFADALEDVFVNDLCIRTPNHTGGFVAPVMKAKFQADAAIIGRLINGESLMAITSDSDIPILAGGDFVALKVFTKDGSMTMVCTTKATLQNLVKFLPDDSLSCVKLEDAKCPVFEGVESRRMRVLMMVMLGCDVYEPGMKQIGATKLKAELNFVKDKLLTNRDTLDEEQFYHEVLKHVAKFTGLGVAVVDTLVRGIIFEPKNAVSAINDGGLASIVTEAKFTYFDGASPDYLPEYLLDMASPQTNLDDAGPSILLCEGVGDRKHLFLGRTGWSRCSGCNKVVCGHCSTVKQATIDHGAKKTNHRLCLGCYAMEMLVPNHTDKEHFRKIDAKRKELRDIFKYDEFDKLSEDEVDDVHNHAVLTLANHQNHTVHYPLHTTNELKQPTEWEHLFDILSFAKAVLLFQT